ncbi:hypothetical protein OR571_09130 [Psychrobacillus sp. NEAU-3TGS]|uniref:DnaA N-terminal domain-containing protein n=1 Tax=Psychrobacillus sp. NEAU-3TGS TaxID=2995412 RepID=UPI002498D57A|nr:DnaA N-terminal domain-containing protein [Psychrobacillus sp. NEAU-3TGS]MDI2587261.1 hypothetical protein [Psychrobacillus sp. NEAU-3TGS]
MVNIESEAELLLHFKSMKADGPVSTINIPRVGTFKILLEEIDDTDREKKLQNEKSNIIDGEEFADWYMVLMILERDISPAPFETWLKGTWAVKIKDQHICVNCNNSFQLDWVKKHYYSKILSTVKEVTRMEYFWNSKLIKKLVFSAGF